MSVQSRIDACHGSVSRADLEAMSSIRTAHRAVAHSSIHQKLIEH